jgi:hypothetical protein
VAALLKIATRKIEGHVERHERRRDHSPKP